MSKRANGEGSIYKNIKRGVWVAAVSIDGRRVKRSAPTQKEAKALRDQLLKDASLLASRDTELRTVNDLLSAWLESQTASDSKAASTLDTSRWAVEYLRRHLGSVKLSRLDFHEIEAAFKVLAGPRSNLSRSSLIKIKTVLNQACKWGVRREVLASNPVAKVELPRTKHTDPRRSLTLEEFDVFRASLAGSRLEVLWLIFLMLGLRSGEARALHWKDWDRKNASLAVRRSIRRNEGLIEVSEEMKTPAARRNIQLPKRISELLESHFEKAQLDGNANPDDLIFRTVSGRPLDDANLRRDLRHLCKAAGIPPISVHELRHTCASILADKRMAPEEIADLLGHRDIRTTLGTYRHAIGASVSGHVATIDQILSQDPFSAQTCKWETPFR